MGKHQLGFLLITKGTAARKRIKWGVCHHWLQRKLKHTAEELISLIWSDTDLLACESARLSCAANQMQTERCIWVRLYCSSSSSTAQLWARLCRLVPPWISTTWKGSGSRRYGVRSWANSDWRVLRTPSDRVRSPIKSKHCITAPRSYWRSSGGIGSRVAVRTTQRQSTMPKRYTNSTWSTDRQRAVSITIL